MKVLKWTLGLLVAFSALVAIVGMTSPGRIEFSVEGTVISSIEKTYEAVADLKAYRQWEPIGRSDPSYRVEFEELTQGVGAAFRFSSDRSAYGRLEIVATTIPTRIAYETRFVGDLENPVFTTITLEAVSPNLTRVKWDFRGSATANPLGRIFMRVWKPTVERIHFEGIAALDAFLNGRLGLIEVEILDSAES